MTAGARDGHGAVLPLLAVLAGSAMASNSVLQPLLPEVALAFPSSTPAASLAAGAGPLGYVLGLIWLVPLGDIMPVRSVVVWQSLALAILLVIAATVRVEAIFLIALVLGGAAATVTAHCIALSGHVAPGRPGHAVGIVVMGVSIGILAGRVLAGAVGQRFGWPAPLAILAAMVAATAIAVQRFVPPMGPQSRAVGWRTLLLSVPRTMSDHADIRRATAVGCLWFAAFSAFWSALAFHLAEPPLSRGAAFAGGFGLIGIAGAVMAQLAGRAADRWGSRAVVFVGLVAALCGFAILALFPSSLIGLAIGALVMDAGCFTAHAATQAHILRTGGEERSRRYGAYMTVYWCAGAMGASTGPLLFAELGWSPLNIICGSSILLALPTHARKRHLAPLSSP